MSPARALVLAVALAIGCGDDETGDGESPTAATATESAWGRRLSEGAVAELVAALEQSHATARQALGPHRIHVTSESVLAPPEAPADALPELDSAVVLPQAVKDEVDVRWAGDASHVALTLAQANDHDRGREVVIVDERVYFKKRYRSWLYYPLESDLWQRWLDDAWWSVRDAVVLAAPQLAIEIEPRAGEGWAGGDALAVVLTRSEQLDAERIPSDPSRAWRRDARIEGVEGTLLIDAASGLWLSADVTVRYAVQGADGRPLTGRVAISAKVEADAGGPVAAPPDAAPLPERPRYEVEAQRLLDGLAAP